MITTVDDLSAYIKPTSGEQEAVSARRSDFPMKITDHYARLLEGAGADYPLRRIVVPSLDEMVQYPDDDQLDVHADEAGYQPVEGIVHRYPGKLLMVPTLGCFAHCRFCFRSGKKIETLGRDGIEQALDYVREHKDIRDVIITGGDPLILDRSELEFILSGLRSIDHVEIIRITTRAPVYEPKAVDDAFARMAAKYKPVFLLFSFVHPREITPETSRCLNMLADSGFVMLQQGPILKGINDDVKVLKELYETLARHRVTAYYAIWGIPARGIRHFAIDGDKAGELIRGLHNRTSGFCVPHLSTLDQKQNKLRVMG